MRSENLFIIDTIPKMFLIFMPKIRLAVPGASSKKGPRCFKPRVASRSVFYEIRHETFLAPSPFPQLSHLICKTSNKSQLSPLNFDHLAAFRHVTDHPENLDVCSGKSLLSLYILM